MWLVSPTGVLIVGKALDAYGRDTLPLVPSLTCSSSCLKSVDMKRTTRLCVVELEVDGPSPENAAVLDLTWVWLCRLLVGSHLNLTFRCEHGLSRCNSTRPCKSSFISLFDKVSINSDLPAAYDSQA
jgi:hypothetical protein